MSLPKRYNPRTAEPQLQTQWLENGVYHFEPESKEPVYSIDTPPPTVSGQLHLGHVYSYSHADFFARFWRMNGRNVFYPMGYDDNGLPTEKLVERTLGIRATDLGREEFIQKCLAVSEEVEKKYQALWQRLGLSIDWRYTYRTIDDRSRRLAQWSFLDLYEKGLAYRRRAPSIWCPECQTAIAQAELDDLERETTFYTLDFRQADGTSLPIATTRPELLPACVAVFVHPEDGRFTHLLNQTVTVPYFGQAVPILADSGADPEKGTGVVMCCTFGDQADVAWWHTHQLPLVEVIGRDGSLTDASGEFAGMPVMEARQAIATLLAEKELLLAKRPSPQSVRIHERCVTAVEYIVTWQWFVRLLDAQDAFLKAGDSITWQPPHMKARYRQWVENLGWDWCITRQRYFGVSFPIWYCVECGQVMTADKKDLPIDPTEHQPNQTCSCGSEAFIPERDVMDTWATSSLTPQIVGQWTGDFSASDDIPSPEQLYDRVFPFSLRTQAHEIIRTWAFYTIVKSHYHFGKVPWRTIVLSGWGLAPEGTVKLSKSRGGGPVGPMEMIEQYSADAVRYWAAGTNLGKDAIIDEQKIQAGAKLVTKLWNVARFSKRFIGGWSPGAGKSRQPLPDVHSTSNHQQAATPADRWIMSRTQQLIERVTQLYGDYDYATAKSEIEAFFWRDLADNYLEMAKMRLYAGGPGAEGAKTALYTALLTTMKLFAPLLPYVTERIFQGLFAESEGADSIHRAAWPQVEDSLFDKSALSLGEYFVEIATAVRRYKSEQNLSLGAELSALQIVAKDAEISAALQAGEADIISITRARTIQLVKQFDPSFEIVLDKVEIKVALAPPS